VLPIHPTSIHWIIRFGGNARVLTRAAKEPVPEFQNAFSLIWSALPKKATDSAATDYTANDCRQVCPDIWTKIGVNIGIYLRNNQDNFQLYMFTTRENIEKKL